MFLPHTNTETHTHTHTARQKLLFTLHLQFWVRLLLFHNSRGRKGKRRTLSPSSIAPLAQAGLIIIFTNSTCDLREGLSACPRFDGLATRCKLCLCSFTSALVLPPPAPPAPLIFMCSHFEAVLWFLARLYGPVKTVIGKLSSIIRLWCAAICWGVDYIIGS